MTRIFCRRWIYLLLPVTSQRGWGFYLSIWVKGETGDSVCVDVPQNGHGLHGIGVPDTDVRVLSHLTRRHLDLIWMHGQTERQTGRKVDSQTDRELFEDWGMMTLVQMWSPQAAAVRQTWTATADGSETCWDVCFGQKLERMWTWFGHMQRRDSGHIGQRMLNLELSGRRLMMDLQRVVVTEEDAGRFKPLKGTDQRMKVTSRHNTESWLQLT